MKKTLFAMLLTAFAAGAAGYAYGEKMSLFEQALKNLEWAKQSLDKAQPDKAGHRAKAITLINGAILELRQGLDEKH
jgi:hypothetical protein